MSRAEKPMVSPIRLILGLAVVAVGLILTLDAMDLIYADDYLIFWPVVLIAIGLVKAYGGRVPDYVFGGILILVGAWILAYNLGWVNLFPQDYLVPALLVIVGAYLVMGGLRRRNVSADDPESFISAFAFWSGIERTSSSEDFHGADLTAIMGGVELDLQHAQIQQEGRAVIHVFTLWGGIDLKVPPNWNLDIQIAPLLGGYSDETDQSPWPGSPTLVIKGAAIMAGVDIKNPAGAASPKPEDTSDSTSCC